MATVRAEGLAEFRREIKKVDKEFGKALRQAHLRVAELVAEAARSGAPTSVHRAIKARATQKDAAVLVKRGRGDAIAKVMGAKRRTGWYAARRYEQSAGKQHQPWVGNQWQPGDFGGKPYFIGDPINQSIDDVIDVYANEIEKLVQQAFPDGRW